MADSDGEFVADDASSDDLADHQVTRGGQASSSHNRQRRHSSEDDDDDDDDVGRRVGEGGGRRGAAGGGGRKRKKVREGQQAAWETVKRSWDVVGEGADGLLPAAELVEAEKRRRLLRDTTPLQRGIIRHVILVLDMSFAMAAKDYLPTYHRAVLARAREFVGEFFEQNPISHLGLVGMRDGIAVRLSDLGGNPADHIDRLREWETTEPQGNPSLQNALEMCRGALLYVYV